MTVIHRMDHRQTTAVVAVGISAQLMLDLMRLEVSQPADFLPILMSRFSAMVESHIRLDRAV